MRMKSGLKRNQRKAVDVQSVGCGRLESRQGSGGC